MAEKISENLTDKIETVDKVCKEAYREKTAEPYTWTRVEEMIIWKNALGLIFFNTTCILAVAAYILNLYSVPIKTSSIIWAFVVGYGAGMGVTAGAHRLWTHRAYKAKLPLKILLMILYTAMGMNSLFHWIRDHRVHHKYSETDADPHNAKRGFFFSHVGWLMMRRHPECFHRLKAVDMSDIISDPIVMFQKKNETKLTLLLCFVIPTAIPIILWEETILHAILSICIIRYTIAINVVSTVNSVAHLWGNRPYNRLINPAENALVSLITVGEGSHNYHHTFPWDYKTSEFPYMNFNLTTLFIDAMAKIGWAYDRRKPSPDLVEKVINRIGYKSELAKAY